MKFTLAAVLLLSLVAAGAPQLEGKAMPLRAAFYPLAALAVPSGWVLAGRRPPYPHAADALVVSGLVIDTAGNLVDAYSWDPFDDVVHGSDSALRTLGIALLAGRLRIAPWNAAALALGFTLTAHTAWELIEFALERWLDANLNVSYADRIGDSALALSGASAAALAARALLSRRGQAREQPS